MSRAEDFKIEVSTIFEGLRLVMRGSITEESVFPPFPEGDPRRIVVELSQVTRLNSWGVRLWMKWLWDLEKAYPSATLQLESCSPLLVQQLLVVRKFFPANARVRSVLLPYACTSCSAEHQQTFEAADPRLRRILQGGSSTILLRPCDECGSAMELEVNPKDYLKIFEKDSGTKAAA